MKKWMIPLLTMCLLAVPLTPALLPSSVLSRAEAAASAAAAFAMAAQPPRSSGEGVSSASGVETLTDLVALPGNYPASDYVALRPPLNYGISGGLVTFNWSDVEIAEGDYDWSPIDDWIALQQNAGKKSIIGISTYNGRCCGGVNALPEYLRTDPQVVWTSYLGEKIPYYWRDQYLQPYEEFVRRLGNRYRNHPDVEAISIGIGRYGELAAWDPLVDAVYAEGLGEVSVWVWINTAERIIDAYKAAFSAPSGELQAGEMTKVLFAQTASYTYNASERRNVADYAVQQGLALSINGLYPEGMNMIRGDTGDTNRYTGMFDQITRYDEAAGVRDSGTGLPVPFAFETYDYMIGCDGDERGDGGPSVYWAILNALDKHPQYMRLNIDLFAEAGADGYSEWPLGPDKDENIDIFRWAQPYLHATVDNTPSVWVALRDVRVPWQTCWQANASPPPVQQEFAPERGNRDFWLYQLDNISGGQTVVETNTCTTYSGTALTKPVCNPSLPEGREGWVIRRTNEPSNGRMYFDVDEGYINGGVNEVTITVTYWDNAPNDRWRLIYDGVTGPAAAKPVGSATARVQKTGSNTYRQAVFEISDAAFADRLDGGTDFFIDSNGDGNEWIHFVDVTNGEFTPVAELPTPLPTPTGTLTVTPTPTSTPTATSTPRPNTGRIHGKACDDHGEPLDICNAGEAGVPGLVVQLYLNATQLVSTRVTNANGYYAFEDLDQGTYEIRGTAPPGWQRKVTFDPQFHITGADNFEWNYPLEKLATAVPTLTPAMYLPLLTSP